MNLCFLLEPARFITSLDWTAEQMHGTRTAFRLNWWYKKEIEFHAVNIKFVQGKVNYLNINFKLLKTEGTQAFLNVLKMKLGRVRPDTQHPPFTTHRKIQSALREGARKRSSTKKLFWRHCFVCLRWGYNNKKLRTCDETKTDRKAFLLTNFNMVNVALTIKRQTLG